MEKEEKKKDFTPREYQVRLSEMAIERNKIIFLPTGSGKTFLSTMVITHFLRKDECAKKKLEAGGKRAFFLVNTVALVHQQVEQITATVPFDVKGYSGDMGVDQWNKAIWSNELEANQILVMTAQIFLDMLLTNIITLKEVAVVVFDECHHGVENHPMRQIMQRFKDVPKYNQPRVVGLTATLINKNLPVHKVKDEIRTLENTYLAEIATADDENMVLKYSTNPGEFRVLYQANDTTKGVYTVRDKFFAELTDCIETFQISDEEKPDGSIRPKDTFQIEDRSKKPNKVLKNVLMDIKVNMDDLGLYGGDVSVLARLIQLQRLIYNSKSEVARTALSIFKTELTLLRKYFETQMGELTEQEKIDKYLSDKVKKLFGILKKMKGGDCAIVFVRRRFTAKIMHRIVSKAAKVDPKLSHINCDFVVGYNVTNPFNDTRENLLQRNYNNKVLENFNCGHLNVLFGSNVVEEGMDIRHCNMVVMFDEPMDFRAFIQSKGRARHPESRYIIMTCDPKYIEKHGRFREVEDCLQNMLCGGEYRNRQELSEDEIDASLFSTIPGLEPFKPRGEGGPTITALSAVSHVNRYFSMFKVDKFTTITPYWFMKNEGAKFQCFLYLPRGINLRGLVKGTWQSNKENAKRSVALECCKLLFKYGQLDEEHLLPIAEETKVINNIGFMPHWNTDEIFFEEDDNGKTRPVGTKNNKRFWTKKWPECLTGCMPKAETQVYLHVLDIKVMYQPPADNHRLLEFHQNLCEPTTYAILSSKKLPKLAPFPLFMSTGELEVNVLQGEPRSFSKDELEKISIFHSILFDKVIKVKKSFLIRDYTNDQNSYLIAPVTIGANTIDINWDVIERANEPFPDPEVKPTDDKRKGLVVNDENYKGKIVTPWYRTVPAQRYIVTDVCHNKNENTEFPSDNYATYKEYFIDKYKIAPLLKNQPLLEVRALSSRMNNLTPIAVTKALKRKIKDENEEFEVWLVPEFCHVYPVPGCYWVKALLIPSVLHRVGQLCAAEEFRVRLVRDTGIGLAVFPPGHKLKKIEADVSLAKKVPVETTQLLTPLTMQMKSISFVPKTNCKAWEKEEEPIDIDREMDISLFDIRVYDEFVNKPLCSQLPDDNSDEPNTKITTTESGMPMTMDPDSTSSEMVASGSLNISTNEPSTSIQTAKPNMKRKHTVGLAKQVPAKKSGNVFNKIFKKETPKFVTPPPLKVLQKTVQGLGPEQVQVLQAITAALANDFINCERLETLGDSFLKFSISLVLFETQDLSEGALTNIKGQVVGNKNLYFCGKDKNLGNILEVRDFSPREEWIPPQFCVEHTILGTIIKAQLSPSCLYKMNIPEEEVLAGRISEATRQEIRTILFDAESLENNQTCALTNQLALSDKNISDAVEAVLGVYLESSGIFGALRVMNWFGVMDPLLATENVFMKEMSKPLKGAHGSPMDHLLEPDRLEEILNYKFKDRAYMLQALSHSSYQRNIVTQSYERLEFIGDAIIDFLITIHIYERCTELHPGDLTDLRSALVNNITLGCITVRHGLHRFLLHRSNMLNDMITRFVKHQEGEGHKIDNDILFLCEEKETIISETIEIPKALGDVFESLIGAIYLDSGKNLDITWSTIYNLMKDEIEQFHSDVPKNHVRMLYESKCGPDFSSSVRSDGVVAVSVKIMHEGEIITCFGFGDSKRQAKRAAAKMALRLIRGAPVKDTYSR